LKTIIGCDEDYGSGNIAFKGTEKRCCGCGADEVGYEGGVVVVETGVRECN